MQQLKNKKNIEISQKNQHLNTVKKPSWLKTPITGYNNYFSVKKQLRSQSLVTVCEQAKCPNIGQCWNDKIATFMVLGDTCTRACRFCNIKTGNPGGWLDQKEPQKLALSVKAMQIKYVVITMVDRDDLDDGGADHLIKVIKQVKIHNPSTKIEILAGDFTGNFKSVDRICANQEVVVYAHNLETVERLSPRVRDHRADYRTSLSMLKRAKNQNINTKILTKSSIMLGLGESIEEIKTTLKDLKKINCDLVTMGQYMRPSKKHLSIKKWITPDTFNYLKQYALDLGFKGVNSHPLSRSSHKALQLYKKATQDN